MSLIDVENLSFSYEGTDEIFKNVSFQMDTNWKLALIGRNGRGKTTFLNLLLGKYKYSGKILSSVDFDYFPYEVKNENRICRDILNEILDFEEWQILKEMSFLKLNFEILDRVYSTLSHGEKTKLLLAALFLKQDNFLLIDEPTNHLDKEARKIVGEYLSKKKSFILVSHDRELLDECVDHVMSINKMNIEIQKGNFSSWYENQKLRDEFEKNKNEKLKKDIKRLEDSSKRTKIWSDRVESTKIGTKNSGLKPDRGYVGHKSAKLMKRAKSLKNRTDKAIEEKSKLLLNTEIDEKLKISPIVHISDNLLTLDSVSIFYCSKKVCENVSFSVRSGDRLALVGENGSGKSSILKLIAGENLAYDGRVNRASNLKISKIPQDTSHLSGTLSEFSSKMEIDESLLKTILRKMDFKRSEFERDISNFSEGEKKKVLIAGSLCERANLYIWDEPLNFIDVITRLQIEEVILNYEPTILFVEHDQRFVKNVANKIVNI